MASIGVAIYVIVDVALNFGNVLFWEIFIWGFITGLFQSWFCIEFIKMLIVFYQEWNYSHPKPKDKSNGRRESSAEKAKRGFILPCIKLLSFIFCWWIYCFICCCCRKPTKRDEMYDGQNEYGVNFHEYLHWKAKELDKIGNRSLPRRYEIVGFQEIEKNINDAKQRVNEIQLQTNAKLANTTQAAINKVEKGKEQYHQTKEKVMAKKEKLLNMSMKLGVNRNNGNNSNNTNNNSNISNEEQINTAAESNVGLAIAAEPQQMVLQVSDVQSMDSSVRSQENNANVVL